MTQFILKLTSSCTMLVNLISGAQLPPASQPGISGLIQMTTGVTSAGVRFTLITLKAGDTNVAAAPDRCILVRLKNHSNDVSFKGAGRLQVRDELSVTVSAPSQSWVFFLPVSDNGSSQAQRIEVDRLFTCHLEPGNTHETVAAQLFRKVP